MEKNEEEDFKIPNKANLLIVEDLPEIREILVDDLESINFSGKIFQAKNLTEALSHTKVFKIDFIFLDQKLPDGKGVEFAKKLREHESFKSTPILMISANDYIDDILSALENGVDHYLIKPWSFQELEDAMQYTYQKALSR